MAMDYDWVEIVDPATEFTFYANPSTGECAQEKPDKGSMKTSSPEGDWWELWDDKHQLPYYYHTRTKKTEWVRPSDEHVIPLIKIQSCTDTSPELVNRITSMIKEPLMEEQTGTKRHSRSLDLGSANNRLHHRHQRSTSDGAKDALPVQDTVATSLPTPSNNTHHINGLQDGDKSSGRHTTGSRSSTRPRRLSNFSAFASFAGFTRSSKSPVSMSIYPLFSSFGRSSAGRNTIAVSSPINNPDAAASMSPFHSATSDSSPKSSSASALLDQTGTKPALPAGLRNEISRFAIDGYAQKYFATHKRGLFRRRVSINEMLQWTKDSIKQPLIMLNKSLNKDALKCFKLIQCIMGDRSRPKNTTDMDDYQTLLNFGISKGQMRDEIYVQVCKQLSNNPNSSSVRKGWEILCVIVVTFPPSQNLETYLVNFVRQHHRTTANDIHIISEYVSDKLKRICIRGAKGKVLTPAEIQRAKEAPFNPSVFGETLEFIMQQQNEHEVQLKIPKIVPFLVEEVRRLNGQQSEGIFRVPGDADNVTDLRVRIENDNYDASGVTDPNVPASLLKYWLRDLSEPVITPDKYEECIACSDDPDKAIAIINTLPEVNRRIILFMISFLQEFMNEEVIAHTRMSVQNLAMVFAPNFLRCPSDNLTTVFENSKYEQTFVRTLLNHLTASQEACLHDDDDGFGKNRAE